MKETNVVRPERAPLRIALIECEPMLRTPICPCNAPALIFALGRRAGWHSPWRPCRTGLLNDGDTYWHIRAGEWMIAHGAVLRSRRVLLLPSAGAPWHTQEWLAEILMALGWRGGLAGYPSVVRRVRLR